MKGAIFLDRDGTVIVDRDYPRDPAEVQLIPEAISALQILAAEGWPFFVISNQSGVGRGLITQGQKEAVHHRFLELLQHEGLVIQASYFCPHVPEDGCACRKPSPGLLHQAAREHALDLTRSWMIGDREADFLCGKNAGCRALWLRSAVFPGGTTDWPAIPAIIAENMAEDNKIS